jgi:hypothetical protein
MAKYTEQFKSYAVGLLKKLKEKGIIVIDGIEVKNVRQLVHELDISSYSLYGWVKIFSNRIECTKESWCKAYQPISDENENCNLLSECADFIDIKDELSETTEIDFFDSKDIEVSIVSTGEKKEIFGIRYYSWFARNLSVKGYSSMVLAQLKLAIGNKLIEQSGLIDMNKASKKLKQNGEGL